MANPTTTGPYRPDLHKAIEAFVDAGFAGLQLRLNDEHGEWVASASVRKLGDTDRPPTSSSPPPIAAHCSPSRCWPRSASRSARSTTASVSSCKTWVRRASSTTTT